MDSKFNPPKTKEEFLERAKPVTLTAALAIRNALRHRIQSATHAFQVELNFYEKVIELHEKGDVEWKPEGDK